MPPKISAKAQAGRQRKAEAQDAKYRAEQAKKQQQEEASWEKGAKGKSKKDADAERKALEKQRKDEAKRLLAEEEQSIKTIKPARGAEKVAARKESKIVKVQEERKASGFGLESFAASNIDDALDLMATDKISANKRKSSTNALQVEKHPERRVKAAYQAYEDTHLAAIRQENPSLRLTQVKELLWKQWQKAPENPFNQLVVAPNASKAEIQEAIEQVRKSTEGRLRIE